MARPDYCILKGAINDLVNRQAKFGSFKASKDALDNKYGKPFNTCPGGYANHFSYFKNSDEIAGINYYREADKNNILVCNGVKEITTKTLNYQTAPNQDKFIRMYGYDAKSDCCYSVFDSNNNGYVDKEDKIKLTYPASDSLKYTEVEKTIAEFLGL